MLAPLAEWRSRTGRIMLELKGKAARVAGAAGIGLGVATALAGAGMNLALGVLNGNRAFLPMIRRHGEGGQSGEHRVDLRLLHSPRAQPGRAVVEARHVRIEAAFDLAEAWEKA
jgi:hypothetical protein